MVSVSLNGPDNVGKTTQISYIPDCFEVRSGIHDYDYQMKALVETNSLQEWWFRVSTTEEFVTVIMRGLKKRAELPASKEFLVYDRGGIMFEAVCVASIATRERCDLNEAKAIYESVKKTLGINVPLEDIRILLKHGRNVDESVKISLNRQGIFDETYKMYQQLLQKQLQLQEAENLYTDVVDVTDLSIIEVQNKIRAIINKKAKSKPITQMFEHVHVIIAFGGMSESGKSTFAEGTCKKLETSGEKCARLKIGYFMELISAALGSNVYELPEEKQASYLIKELDRFLRSHYWLTAVTIESLHNLETTKVLKQVLGNLLQIVYIEVNEEIRKQRSLTEIHDLVTKDYVKSSRGADKIKSKTDCFIVRNEDCTIDEAINSIYEMLKLKIDKIKVQSLLNKRYSGKVALFSHEFVLSAGSVLIRKSSREICLIHQLGDKGEWLLPKGRKNVDESLEDAAVRETYEETGFRCSLMPLTMKTRATPSGAEHVEDVARKVNNVIEPFMISLRLIGGSKQNQKIIFWYVTQVDEDVPRNLNSQMANENFEAKLVSLEEASRLLTFDEDKALVRMAFKLFEDSYPLQ